MSINSHNEKKYFPIKTKTACKLKWNWSTLYLNSGRTGSCHRTAWSTLTAENFSDFHNTPLKLADRTNMLNGQWPDESCKYCSEVEDAGGFSDRQRHLTIPDNIPKELDIDPMAIKVTPVILEVFFNNYCNLGCLYCEPSLSSSIESEYRKFGNFEQQGVKLVAVDNHFNDLISGFWDWFPTGFGTLERFHILGGEPLLQKEFNKLLDMIEQYPNSNCELNIVTNLMIPKLRLSAFIDRFKKLISEKKIKRVDFTVSIDCWGPQQEYVRWGFNFRQFEDNLQLLLENKWIYLNINQTISALTIKTMPELLVKLAEWRKQRKIGHWFTGVTPSPDYMKGEIFGEEEFAEDAKTVLSLMPRGSDEDQIAYEYMQGLFKQILGAGKDIEQIKNLFIFLKEKDRRRNTNWRELFPWLTKYEVLCGIVV